MGKGLRVGHRPEAHQRTFPVAVAEHPQGSGLIADSKSDRAGLLGPAVRSVTLPDQQQVGEWLEQREIRIVVDAAFKVLPGKDVSRKGLLGIRCRYGGVVVDELKSSLDDEGQGILGRTNLTGQEAEGKGGMINNLEWRFLSAEVLPAAVMCMLQVLCTSNALVSFPKIFYLQIKCGCLLPGDPLPSNQRQVYFESNAKGKNVHSGVCFLIISRAGQSCA